MIWFLLLFFVPLHLKFVMFQFSDKSCSSYCDMKIWHSHVRNCCLQMCVLCCVCRWIHRAVSEPESHHETKTLWEGAVHQHTGQRQGGDEGTRSSCVMERCSDVCGCDVNLCVVCVCVLCVCQAKLAELQDLVMRLVGERNEWYSRYMSAVGNPDLLSSGGEQLHPTDGHTDSPGATAQSRSYKLILIQFTQISRLSETVQTSYWFSSLRWIDSVNQFKTHKSLSHRDSGKYTGNVFRHLFPDRQICCIHTASDFPEYVRAFTHNP